MRITIVLNTKDLKDHIYGHLVRPRYFLEVGSFRKTVSPGIARVCFFVNTRFALYARQTTVETRRQERGYIVRRACRESVAFRNGGLIYDHEPSIIGNPKARVSRATPEKLSLGTESPVSSCLTLMRKRRRATRNNEANNDSRADNRLL